MLDAEEKQTAHLEDSGPQVNILCSVPGFVAPDPDSVNEKVTPSNTIMNWGGVKIAKIFPDIVVKFGSHVTFTEAQKMIFVKQNTETMPVPKIFACYTYDPIQRDIGDYGSLFDTYIFMSYVEGQSLDKVWETYDTVTKRRITSQLKEYLCQLRQISNGNSNYIGSAGHGPVADHFLEGHHSRGPFDSEEDFNNAIIDAYHSKVPRYHVRGFLAGMLSEKSHKIVFTHGDLCLRNIMVHDGYVSGIVDWEYSGWYPEYWEFSKACYTWQWQNDWTDYLAQILEPYYYGYGILTFLSEILW